MIKIPSNIKFSKSEKSNLKYDTIPTEILKNKSKENKKIKKDILSHDLHRLTRPRHKAKINWSHVKHSLPFIIDTNKRIEDKTKENAKINNEYNRSLGTLRPGGFVGQKEMLKNENFEYSVTAITPCKYYIMNDLAINNLVKDHPEIALEFQTALCRIIFDEDQSTFEKLDKKLKFLPSPLKQTKDKSFHLPRLINKKVTGKRSTKESNLHRILQKLPSSLLSNKNKNKNGKKNGNEDGNENENEKNVGMKVELNNNNYTEKDKIKVGAESAITIKTAADGHREKSGKDTKLESTEESANNEVVETDDL